MPSSLAGNTDCPAQNPPLGGSVQTGCQPSSGQPSATPTLAQVTGIGRTGLTGTGGLFASGNQQVAENMLTFLSGSLGPTATAGAVSQTRFINDEWAME